MSEIFAFFFKYTPFFFRRGDFVFESGWSLWQWIALLVGIPLILLWSYRRRWLSRGARIGWLITSLRVALFVLLILMLSRPALVLSSLQPKESLLAILADNSMSMGIVDSLTQRPRGEAVSELLAPQSDFIEALDEKFHLRRFRFAAAAERREGNDFDLDYTGAQTNIRAGLEGILTQTRNLPLGGIVLVTDGRDTASRELSRTLAELKARKIPVHTVGVGPETLSKDVEIAQVSVPRTLLPETMASARVTVRHRGFGGSRGRLEVRENGSLVDSQEILLPRDSDNTTVEASLFPRQKGLKTYEFRIVPLNGEEIEVNNTRTALVDVRDTRPKVLYVEGHPRWEFKFIRRALDDDEYIHLETFLRTALNKFYRLGIESETTLASGFPTQREGLFEYDGLILGSLESSFFSYGQMEIVRDFVAQRGGGFLMLGGSQSFQSGKYRNTPIEEVLPVWLPDDSATGSGIYSQGTVPVSLSDFGRGHPALRLPDDDMGQPRSWDHLPQLKDWNVVDRPKPGAVTLAEVTTPSARTPRPLLAFQRFGRGQALALMTSSTWQWQMKQDSKDKSFETFWRQITRWLVSTAKPPVTVETDRETYSRDEPIRVRAEVRDKSYHAINDAQVEATITTPSGRTVVRPLVWDAREDGVYRVEWIPDEDGLHEVAIQAHERAGEQPEIGEAKSYFVTAGGLREYFDPVRKTDFLRKLAQETGGNYYNLADVKRLPEEILYTPSTSSVTEVREIWDMPINLLLLLALLSAEWILRKREGAI